MRGRMMEFPLTLSTIMDRARSLFGKAEIITRTPVGGAHRYTYADFYRRCGSP
jgi:fatty-acyl-CoA synthase